MIFLIHSVDSLAFLALVQLLVPSIIIAYEALPNQALGRLLERETHSLHAERVTHVQLIYLEHAVRDIDRFRSLVDERGGLVQHNFV